MAKLNEEETLEALIEGKTAAIDWLTITCNNVDLERLLWDEANRLMAIGKAEGNTQKVWNFRGYTGWSCASIRIGNRTDGSILMLSGQAAQMNWPVALAWATNVTRIDIAVTVTMGQPVPNIAQKAYEFIVGPKGCNCKAQRQYSFIVNSEGGQTLYVGSRASDQYGRLYDKGKEDKSLPDLPEGKIWRYEVEFKQYRAKKIASQLLACAKQNECEPSEDIGATVHKWFLSRGVRPIMATDNGRPFLTEISARITDDLVSLQWLSTQVSPTVRRLMKNGKGDQVFAALGLDK